MAVGRYGTQFLGTVRFKVRYVILGAVRFKRTIYWYGTRYGTLVKFIRSTLR